METCLTLSGFGGLDGITGYDSSSEDEEESEKQQKDNNNKSNFKKEEKHNDDNGKEKTKTQTERLIEVASKKIDLLFKDQYNDPFAKIIVNDHFEILSLKNRKFARFLCKCYFEIHSTTINNESINIVVQMLQATAEFGDIKYNLSLRVAEYDGDIYYDLTNEKHQCIKISKEGKWQVLDQTPIPLFRRYNQSPQDLPKLSLIDNNVNNENKDPLEIFFSVLTNIKDNQTKLLAKVALISYFIPNIPHVVLIIHGGKGSAKSTFQLFIKNIVDPAKPPLLTLHDTTSEFIQQLAHNYLATYDNMKYAPRWLSDEVCKAVTGIGQTKRELYTDDEDKIYEYKHCLNFNGINISFSEPDVIDRSIIIELAEIEDKDRRSEQEILHEFYVLRPKLLTFIFDTLAKSMTIKSHIKMSEHPRMADFAIWEEAFARALGYREGEFIKAYYDNIGFQNYEVIDSSPLALAIKKLVENEIGNNIKADQINNLLTVFEGTPLKLLEELNTIALSERINTDQREWPKDNKWLVKRIKIIKSNLQKALGLKIKIERNSQNNSIIKIEKVISANSDEVNLYPHKENLYPSLKDLTPVQA